MNKYSDVDVSLSQGQLYGTKHFVVLWLGNISSSLLIVVGIILMVLSCTEWNSQMFIVALLGILVGMGFFSVLIYCFVKDKKTKRQVVMWLSDAIKTTAFSKKVDEYRAGFQPSAVKIRVEFSLNGIKYVRESSATCFGGRPGYLGTFKPYANKRIDILYSPKYDEVLILKEAKFDSAES
ncbi:MAG: hypothetical protein J1F33_01340 [Clostridiales bacterium]|nr:hypothetical protein [Clostridiales bacterium]